MEFFARLITQSIAHQSNNLAESITLSVEKFAIEFTDPDGVMYKPSVVVNTWVQVDRDTAAAISEQQGLNEGDPMFLRIRYRAFGILFCMHSFAPNFATLGNQTACVFHLFSLLFLPQKKC